jgi:hypothetical protein
LFTAVEKFAEADVMFGDTGDNVASVTDRTFEFSTNTLPVTAPGVSVLFTVSVPTTGAAPVQGFGATDVTNVRAGTPVPVIDRFTHEPAPRQSATVMVEAVLAVAANVRAAPLWYTALAKSWIVNVDDTKSPPPAVE